ncbi:Holliday junction resolvase [Candidatus Woesearchaeota archaeon]|jgi:holliday junction resolvase Hjr|nr:Holliday junction resolvase [Candidatus Woesearchaeota archaeon]MBT5740165.1 Holliday junction resolvase [Candidatus Woesearchaeota archaeon]
MNHKAKGTQGERVLVKAFNEAGWSCIRAAGSGSSPYPAPDLLAGNAIRRVAIECKVTAAKKKYLSKEEISQLQQFSHQFGAEAWIGIRFSRQPWYFLHLEDLEDTGKSLAVSQNMAKLKGISLSEFFHLTE